MRKLKNYKCAVLSFERVIATAKVNLDIYMQMNESRSSGPSTSSGCDESDGGNEIDVVGLLNSIAADAWLSRGLAMASLENADTDTDTDSDDESESESDNNCNNSMFRVSALQCFDQATALQPGSAEAWFHCGNYLHDSGEFTLVRSSFLSL
jgi:hypothetical protein